MSRSIRWPSFRESSFGDGLDIPLLDVGFDDSLIGGLIAAIVIGIVLAIVIAVLLPFFLLIVEVAIAVVGSLFLRRAWIVTARTLGPPLEVREWRVRGLLRTRGAVREVADELRRGVFAHPEHAEPER